MLKIRKRGHGLRGRLSIQNGYFKVIAMAIPQRVIRQNGGDITCGIYKAAIRLIFRNKIMWLLEFDQRMFHG